MTLNCYKFKLSQNFALLRIFGRHQRLSEYCALKVLFNDVSEGVSCVLYTKAIARLPLH